MIIKGYVSADPPTGVPPPGVGTLPPSRERNRGGRCVVPARGILALSGNLIPLVVTNAHVVPAFQIEVIQRGSSVVHYTLGRAALAQC